MVARLPKRKSKNAIDDDFVPVTWSQVGGQEHVVEEVRKVIEYPILHSEILKKMEYKMPKGFLFMALRLRQNPHRQSHPFRHHRKTER